LIGICFGLTFMLGMLMSGRRCSNCSAAGGNVLEQAVPICRFFFGGAVLPWLMIPWRGFCRGTGNMKLPSLMILSSAVCQIVLGGTLGLGPRPGPQFGMRGVARRLVIAYSISISVIGGIRFGTGGVVPKIRASYQARDVRRHPEIGRRLLLLAAAVGAHHQASSRICWRVSAPRSCRLRHRRPVDSC